MKKIVKISMAFFVLLLFQSVMVVNVSASQKGSQWGNNTVKPTNIRITNSPGKLTVGTKYTFKTSIIPSNASDDSLTWSVKSSNGKKIATINQKGVLTAIAPGTVRVIVTTSNGKSNDISLTITDSSDVGNNKKASSKSGEKNVEVTDIKISGSKEVLLTKRSVNLKAEVSPSDASNKKVTWSSSNTNIATVDKDGKVYANAVGAVEITATASNGVKRSVKINVADVKFSKTNITVSKDTSYKLTANVTVPGTYVKIANTKGVWKKGNSNLFSLDYDQSPSISGDANTMIASYSVNVNGKEEGKSTIDFSIFGVNTADYTMVEVIEEGEDYSLPCPEITYDTTSSDSIKFTIKPSDKVAKYIIQRSTNGQTGRGAKWSAASADNVGEKTIQYPYSFAQAKITVYSETGTSRVCYTAPFEIKPKKLSSIEVNSNPNITCPKFTVKETKVKGATSYTLNRYGTETFHTGISKADISISSVKSSDGQIYQYSWLTNQEGKHDTDATWAINKTLESSSNQTLTTSTADYDDKQGLVLVMNELGDVNYCYTDIYSAFDFVEKKETHDGVNIYFERGFSRINDLYNFVNELPDTYKLATANVFYLTEDTFKKNVGNVQGVAFYANVVERDGAGDYGRNSVVHEMGHNLDYMYGVIIPTREQTGKSTYTNRHYSIRELQDIISLHNTLMTQKNSNCNNCSDSNNEECQKCKKCNNMKYLRGYSYKNNYKNDNGSKNGEFWADMVKYSYIGNSDYANDTVGDPCSTNIDIDTKKDEYFIKIESRENEFKNERDKYK